VSVHAQNGYRVLIKILSILGTGVVPSVEGTFSYILHCVVISGDKHDKKNRTFQICVY
jgi:hypothetical protein